MENHKEESSATLSPVAEVLRSLKVKHLSEIQVILFGKFCSRGIDDSLLLSYF